MQQQQGKPPTKQPPENVYLQQPPMSSMFFQQQQPQGGIYAPYQQQQQQPGPGQLQQPKVSGRQAPGPGQQPQPHPAFQVLGSSSGGGLQMPSYSHGQPGPPSSSSTGRLPASQLSLEKRISPPGLPLAMLAGYEQHSVETLCTLGKELVNELMTRMCNIINTLRLNIKGENKPNKPSAHGHGVENVDNVRLQLDYSQLVFVALTEIRLRIDLKLSKELGEGQTLLKEGHPTDADLLRMLSEGPEDEEEEEKDEANTSSQAQAKQLAAQFQQQRRQLIQLSCQAKKLEWLAMNSEPAQLIAAEGTGSGRSSLGGDQAGSNAGAGSSSRRS